MPKVPVVAEAYEGIAALIPQAWETCIYVSCGGKNIPGWLGKSETLARDLHNDLREPMRDGVPRQVIIDDFWIGLRQEVKFTKFYDQHQFGCMIDSGTAAQRQEVRHDLARRLGRMLDVAVWVAHAVGYPWKKSGETRWKRGKAESLSLPGPFTARQLHSRRFLLVAGVTPRERRRSRVVGVTPRRRAVTTVWLQDQQA